MVPIDRSHIRVTSNSSSIVGSVAASLKCDGKYNKGLATNVLPSPTVKEF